MEATTDTGEGLVSGAFRAIVHSAPEGGYWAEVPDLLGCYTQAETLDELVLNLQEAVEGWLEVASRRRQVNGNHP